MNLSAWDRNWGQRTTVLRDLGTRTWETWEHEFRNTNYKKVFGLLDGGFTRSTHRVVPVESTFLEKVVCLSFVFFCHGAPAFLRQSCFSFALVFWGGRGGGSGTQRFWGMLFARDLWSHCHPRFQPSGEGKSRILTSFVGGTLRRGGHVLRAVLTHVESKYLWHKPGG